MKSCQFLKDGAVNRAEEDFCCSSERLWPKGMNWFGVQTQKRLVCSAAGCAAVALYMQTPCLTGDQQEVSGVAWNSLC